MFPCLHLPCAKASLQMPSSLKAAQPSVKSDAACMEAEESKYGHKYELTPQILRAAHASLLEKTSLTSIE